MDIWPYCPQSSVTESLEWLTGVQRCRSAEYRWSLRMRPRQEFQYRLLLTQEQFGQAKLLARNLGASSFFVPLWPLWSPPGPVASGATAVYRDTADPYELFAQGSHVMIWESPTKYEIHTVQGNYLNPWITLVEATTHDFANPALVPLRVGEFAQEFEATRSSFQGVECAARFRIQSGDDYSKEASGLYLSSTYDGHPVVTDRSLALSGVKEQFERRNEEIDSVIGSAYRFPSFTKPEQSGQITWSAQTRAQLRYLLYWLHSRKGQWKSFWAPSWNSDLTVTHEIASADTSIEIADIGFRTLASFPTDIMVLTKAGTRVYCRVTGATTGAAGKEVIGLSAQFGAHLYTWDIASACMRTLCRFSSDRIEISHGPGGSATVTAPIVEAPV